MTTFKEDSPASGLAGPLLVPPREAAPLLGVSERKLWELTKSNTVPHLRIGRKVLYSPRALAAWVDRQHATPQPPAPPAPEPQP